MYLFICVNSYSGSILGLLKVGTKDLYLFDEAGHTRKVENTPAILDFYVHESRQRSGLGKELFDRMLKDENWKPIKCSVDRPSEKLLAFLKKHYGLVRTIPQANNFVLYEGFFDPDDNAGKQTEGQQQSGDNNSHLMSQVAKKTNNQLQMHQEHAGNNRIHITNR